MFLQAFQLSVGFSRNLRIYWSEIILPPWPRFIGCRQEAGRSFVVVIRCVTWGVSDVTERISCNCLNESLSNWERLNKSSWSAASVPRRCCTYTSAKSSSLFSNDLHVWWQTRAFNLYLKGTPYKNMSIFFWTIFSEWFPWFVFVI